jgi:hypothetical protein
MISDDSVAISTISGGPQAASTTITSDPRDQALRRRSPSARRGPDPYATTRRTSGCSSPPSISRRVHPRSSTVQVATHAIGDRGNRVALDAYQAALEKVLTTTVSGSRQVQVLSTTPTCRASRSSVSSRDAGGASDEFYMYWAATRVGPSHVSAPTPGASLETG